MRKQIGLATLCFVAGLFGAMMGGDLTMPQPQVSRQPLGVARAVAESGGGFSANSIPSSANNPVIKAVRRVAPAVVNIDTVVMRRASVFGFSDPFGDMFGSDPFTRLVPDKGQGSGFIIDGDKGYVLTNDHVVQDAIARNGKIKVSLPNKRMYEAQVVGADPQYDVAVLKIDGKNLPSVSLAPSRQLTIGEWAIAIGNPFGFRSTVTLGVVSALDRSLDARGGNRLEGLIQTDAAINPGNSGGPLCDIDGNVVGINTAIITDAQGLGFAIGASYIKPVVDEIIKYGHVRHGWTGMEFWDISERLAQRLELSSTDGALVAEVYRNSPAGDAGIKAGDVVLEANGKKVTCMADVMNVLRGARAGEDISLVLARRSKKINVKIGLVEVPAQYSRQNPNGE